MLKILQGMLRVICIPPLVWVSTFKSSHFSWNQRKRYNIEKFSVINTFTVTPYTVPFFIELEHIYGEFTFYCAHCVCNIFRVSGQFLDAGK